MNNKLYDALENSLSALEEGQDLDAVLARYPDLAKQLRPMLETSLHARTMGGAAVSSDIQRRGRSRLLQRAAEMREAKRSKRRVIPMFSRMALTLGLVGVLVLSSTGLVNASSGSLPGDQLYPVKRTWEGVRLFFVFSPGGRDLLESQFEQERLDEIDELLAKGRSISVVFSGLVTRQQDGQWLISGIPVQVSAATRLPAQVIPSGAPVMVTGLTREDGIVEAQEIQLLQAGASLPPLEPSERNNSEGEHGDSNPAPTSQVILTPRAPVPETGSNQNEQEHHSYEFSGVVQSVQDGIWVINGQTVSVNQADIKGNIAVGSYVKFEGYYDVNGIFVVTRIELKSGSGTSKGDNTSGSGAGENENNNDNSNTNSNSNESSGSGSGSSSSEDDH